MSSSCLRRSLRDGLLNEEVVAVILKNGITSITMFAKCVDSEKELKPAFITPTAQANSMAEASKLKTRLGSGLSFLRRRF